MESYCNSTKDANSLCKPQTSATAKVIFVEPFYGGSHKQLIDVLTKSVTENTLITLKAKKWHWRARCSALSVAFMIPPIVSQEILFCSSVVSLAELLGLRPDLNRLKKIVYFHENQLVYPKQAIKERDIQFAYNQITTCIAADAIVFNSNYNKNSFLNGISRIIRMLPDNRPNCLKSCIEPKCVVIYFPLELPVVVKNQNGHDVLHIVWPHRWEFDKDPGTFIKLLLRLQSEGFNFKVSLIGETFTDVPEVLARAEGSLKSKIINYGFVENKHDYYDILCSSHVVVSTAQHEFFGVSTLEATYCGCLPLVPNRLVYPEIYPRCCLYSNENDLFMKLQNYCRFPKLCKEAWDLMNMDFDKYSTAQLLPEYLKLFAET